jgi:hypothetical protein
VRLAVTRAPSAIEGSKGGKFLLDELVQQRFFGCAPTVGCIRSQIQHRRTMASAVPAMFCEPSSLRRVRAPDHVPKQVSARRTYVAYWRGRNGSDVRQGPTALQANPRRSVVFKSSKTEDPNLPDVAPQHVVRGVAGWKRRKRVEESTARAASFQHGIRHGFIAPN